METLLTSDMVCNCSFTVKSAISLSSSSERLSLWIATIMDGDGIGIGFRYGGRVTVARQIALCTGNFVAHIVGCRFKIDGQFKLYRDAALALLTDAG